MEMEETDSGLVVPVAKPPLEPGYGPLEIRGEPDRGDAEQALAVLWRASGLYENSRYDNQSTLAARRIAWEMLGKMLLGDDCPECEQLT